MISERQQTLLRSIIHEYIKHAQPVGSQLVVERSGVDVSPATVRNDMAVLEDEGYLTQPHTSAGRVPTERAWRFFLNDRFDEKPVSRAFQQALEASLRESADAPDQVIRGVARALAEWMDEAVVIAPSPNDVYYTGLSNLFQQPEFEEHELVCHFSEVMDHLDRVIARLFSRLSDEPQIFIGEDNPFSSSTGAIVTRYRFRGNDGLMAVIGPLRQAYHEHLPMVRYAAEHLRSLT